MSRNPAASHFLNRLRRAKRLVSAGWALPLLVLYGLSSEKSVIAADVRRWFKELNRDYRFVPVGVLVLLSEYREYRNLYYYRLKCGNAMAAFLTYLFQIVYHENSTLLFMTDDIGPGLFIQHGIATIICARHIGANGWINQQVTIGYSGDGNLPTIGDNVFVFCGAKVLGNITVGDNVVIAANAVVIRDVPPNCTVAGVPARIVKRDGIRVDEPL